MLFKKICTNCMTGKMTYELDEHTDVCPYMHCLNGRKCIYYKPIKQKFSFLRIFKK